MGGLWQGRQTLWANTERSGKEEREGQLSALGAVNIPTHMIILIT
jgi:hypothetical protein